MSGLSQKIIFIVISISLFFSVIVTLVQVIFDYKNSYKQLDEVYSIVEKSYLPAIASSRFFLDDQQLELLINGLTLFSAIDSVEITEDFMDESNVVIQAGDLSQPERIIKEYELIYNYNGVYRKVGKLRISSSLNFIRQRVKDIVFISIYSNLIKVFVLAVVIILFFHRLILRHLKKISNYVEKTDLFTERSAALHLERKYLFSDKMDEIDEIVSVINNMYERLFLGYEELKQARDEIKDIASESETLIRELYHRTKNNMQLIISLLKMQSIKLQDNIDMQQLVTMTINRINAMAIVHQMLYKTHDLSYIKLNNYLSELSQIIILNYNNSTENISFQIDVDDIRLSLDTAIPIGLVMVELLSNSVKHAFSDQPHPKIILSVEKKDGNDLSIFYTDNGSMSLNENELMNKDSLGMKLVYSIVESQLYGKIELSIKDSMECTIIIPDPSANKIQTFKG